MISKAASASGIHRAVGEQRLHADQPSARRAPAGSSACGRRGRRARRSRRATSARSGRVVSGARGRARVQRCPGPARPSPRSRSSCRSGAKFSSARPNSAAAPGARRGCAATAAAAPPCRSARRRARRRGSARSPARPAAGPAPAGRGPGRPSPPAVPARRRPPGSWRLPIGGASGSASTSSVQTPAGAPARQRRPARGWRRPARRAGTASAKTWPFGRLDAQPRRHVDRRAAAVAQQRADLHRLAGPVDAAVEPDEGVERPRMRPRRWRRGPTGRRPRPRGRARAKSVAVRRRAATCGAIGPWPRSSGAAKRTSPSAPVVGLGQDVVVGAPSARTRTPGRGRPAPKAAHLHRQPAARARR